MSEIRRLTGSALSGKELKADGLVCDNEQWRLPESIPVRNYLPKLMLYPLIGATRKTGHIFEYLT